MRVIRVISVIRVIMVSRVIRVITTQKPTRMREHRDPGVNNPKEFEKIIGRRAGS